MDRRRREERIAVSLPIRVWGMDASHKPFSQAATTLDLTRAGVRVGGLNCQLPVGEIIGLQHGTEKARFRVIWVGKKGGPQNGQAGLTCVEAGKYIWGPPLQRLATTSKLALGPSDATVPAAVPASREPDKSTERRADTRYAATGGAEVANLDGSGRIWGVITDVGQTGCYVETITPPKAGTTVRLVLTLQGADIHCKAEVRNSHVGVGMGLSFLDMSSEDRHRLNDIVQRIAAGVTTPMMTPISKTTEPVATAEPDPKAVVLAGHVRCITGALRAIEDLIGSSKFAFETRVMQEFRRTLDHTRQNTWAVQRWLEEGADQAKIYRLLDEMEVRRMRSATALVHELSMDIDGNALHLGTAGLDELAAAVEQLRIRLLALKQGQKTVPEVEEQLPR